MANRQPTPVNELVFFDGLAASTITALQSIARYQTLVAGQHLFNQGDTARAFYVVLSGGVRLVEHTTEGKALNLKVYGPGDVFGLLAIAGGFTYHAGVVALTTSDVIAFDGVQTRQLLHQHPDLALRIIDELVDHVHHSHDRIRQMAVEKVRRRVARALLHFCSKFGQTEPDNRVSANFSQKDIAEFTGTTIETVNRFLREWEKLGYIEWKRMRIILLEPEKLHQIADDNEDMGMTYLVE